MSEPVSGSVGQATSQPLAPSRLPTLRLPDFVRTYSSLVALAALVIFNIVFTPNFLTAGTFNANMTQVATIVIVAVGMTFVILTGGIDLSVGSVAGLTGIVLGLTLAHLPIPLAIAVAVLAGGGIGLVSGLLINVFGLASFVVTLGMMAIGRSLAYILSGQTAISDIPAGLQDIVYTDVLGIPSRFIPQAKPDRILAQLGLDADGVLTAIRKLASPA